MFQIYSSIISKFPKMKDECIPISNIGLELGFQMLPKESDNEFYRAELVKDNKKIVISIWGSDHSGELQYRKDTYHNCITYIDEKGNIRSDEYMYLND